MKKRTITTLVTSLCAAVALSFSSSAAVAASKTIIVGADTTFPPFETMKDGKVAGFDIDMIRATAEAEGLNVTFKTMAFNGIIPSLQAGSIDAAVAGITIKKSRMENVNFTNAYYKSGLSILVRSDSSITGFKSLKGHVIATKKATSSVDYLRDHGINLDKVKQYQNISAAYQSLMSHGSDAVIFDNPVNLNFHLKFKDKTKIVGPLLTGEYYGIAVTQREPELVKTLNKGLEAIKKDGTYDKLFDKYFGGDENGKVMGVKTPADVAVKD